MKKQLASAFALSLVTTGLVIGGTTVAAQAAVPGCVKTDAWHDFPRAWAKASNTCTSSQRLYFRWDRAVDGGCSTIDRDRSRSEWRVYQARFAGLTNC